MKKSRARHNCIQIVNTSPRGLRATTMYFLLTEVNTDSTIGFRMCIHRVSQKKKYLASRGDSCKALFVTETNPTKRMAIPTIRWALKRLADRGEIEANVYPHRFRHTYACQLLDNGTPLDFIQGMLGHEKASTTQIYAQLRGERRRELYRRFF